MLIVNFYGFEAIQQVNNVLHDLDLVSSLC